MRPRRGVGLRGARTRPTPPGPTPLPKRRGPPCHPPGTPGTGWGQDTPRHQAGRLVRVSGR
eukprot:5268702-Pyramimonas_sp.AAC.1